MHQRLGIGVAVVLGLWLAGTARAADEPKALIEKAIKAHGGAEKLAKLANVRAKGKGNLDLMGMQIPFTMEMVTRVPDGLKMHVEATIQDQKITITKVFDGEKVFVTVGGQAVDADAEELADAKTSIYAVRVTMLTPLLDDKMFKLDALGEIKVNNNPAVGVKVKAKDKPDVDLYFDKETNLLVRYDHEALDIAKQKVMQQTLLSDYKDFDGVKQPAKLTLIRDKNKFMEAEVTEMKFVDKFDAKEFAKP